MSAPESVSLRDIRTLAHSLYCQCQAQLNAYRPISKSIRTLRNRLEEADELFDEAIRRPEDVELLQAASASRIVLERLELTLQRHRSANRKEDHPDESFILDYLENVDAVTEQLSNALFALEEHTGTLNLNIHKSLHRRTLSPPTRSSVSSISVEHRGISSVISDSCSSIPDYPRPLETMGLKQQRTRSDGEVSKALQDRTRATKRASITSVNSRSSNRPASASALRPWNTPFFDPLSLDIDQASHIILEDAESEPKMPVDSGMVDSELNAFPVPPVTTSVASQPGTAGSDCPKILPLSQHDSVTGCSKTRSPALLNAAKGGDRTELDEERATLSAMQEARLMPRALASDVERPAQRLNNDWNESCEKPPITTAIATSSILHAPRPHRDLSSRLGTLRRPPRAPESKYRVVNVDTANASGESTDDDGAVAMRKALILQGSTAPGLDTRATQDIRPAIVPDVEHSRPQEDYIDPWTAMDNTLTTASVTPVESMQALLHQSIWTNNQLDHGSEIDPEMEALVRNWNNHNWNDAQTMVELQLARLSKAVEYETARRLRFLLGVLASLKGEWTRALAKFLSVMGTPITAGSHLDAGDCAAAYWLGDIYAMHDRRAEALLAYSIAERGSLFQDPSRYRLHECVRVEQEACRDGVDARSLRQYANTEDSILNLRIIALDAASSFLSYVRWQPSAQDKPYAPDPQDNRALALWKLGLDTESRSDKERIRIGTSILDPSTPWPLAFDPFFTIANVSQGRLVARECDLLAAVTSNSSFKIARAPTLSRTRVDCFTCTDLPWLIRTLRKILKHLATEWAETSNSQSTAFHARYITYEDKIACINYFSISIFKLSLRPGYGVDVCPDGIGSSRITRTHPDFERGVSKAEVKKVKALVRAYLDKEARKLDEMGGRMVLPVMSANGAVYVDPARQGKAVRYA